MSAWESIWVDAGLPVACFPRLSRSRRAAIGLHCRHESSTCLPADRRGGWRRGRYRPVRRSPGRRNGPPVLGADHGESGGTGVEQSGRRDAQTEYAGGVRHRQRGGASQGEPPGGPRTPARRYRAVAGGAARRRPRTRPATTVRHPRARGDPARRGPAIARLSELPRRLATAGGLRLPGAGAAARAQRIVEEAGPCHAKEPGGGPAGRPRHHTGTEQLAALRRHGGGRPGDDGRAVDTMRIDYAVRAHQQWYVGDGVYGDGPRFHWDYYNSFVIQPMLLDVLRNIGTYAKTWEALLPDVLARARRYAAIQERLISPEGTFPAIGRSICYRTGAFQLLAQMALLGELPAPLTGPRVRAALTAVMKRLLDAPGTFDERGWLTVGFAGHQPHLGESYISTGSLYLCAGVFLPLGLRSADAFWSSPAEDWTSRRIWRGEDAPADHAITV